jgi:hypothetical protein
MPNGVWLLLRVVSACAIATAMTWSAYRIGQGDKAWTLIGFLFSVPLGAWLIAKPLIEFMHEGFEWLAAHPLKAWEGHYYAFNSVHIRVFDDGDRLWFCAQDIVHACHLKALAAAIPGVETVEGLPSLTLDGVRQFHAGHSHPELARFVLWAEREVVTPWERKRSGALIPR